MDKAKNGTFIIALGALVLFLLTPAAIVITGRMTAGQLKALAEKVAADFRSIDPKMLRAIAEIESSRDVRAFRLEPQINDASAGLMQVLLGTAQWMYDIGFRVTAERPERFEPMFDPEISMRWAATYLNYLRTWQGRGRDEEFIVRAYNGGPGGANSAATEPYFQKYQRAKSALT